MEVAILVMLAAIGYGMDGGRTTEIKRLLSTIHLPFGLLRRFIKAKIRLVAGSITGMCILGFEGFYIAEISEGGA